MWDSRNVDLGIKLHLPNKLVRVLITCFFYVLVCAIAANFSPSPRTTNWIDLSFNGCLAIAIYAIVFEKS